MRLIKKKSDLFEKPTLSSTDTLATPQWSLNKEINQTGEI